MIVGVGEAANAGNAPGDALALALAASHRALDDSGLEVGAVDGVTTYGLFGDLVPSEAIGTGLGRDTLRVALDLNLGGQAPALLVATAARAVDAGMADVVIALRAMCGRTGVRVGSASFPRIGESLRTRAGVSAYPITAALWARRYLDVTGLSEEALGQAVLYAGRSQWPSNGTVGIAVAERGDVLADYGPRRLPTDLDAYLKSPLIADPLRRDDCVSEVDGAAAVVVASDSVASNARSGQVRIGASAWRSRQADVDMGSVVGYQDLSRNVSWVLAEAMQAEAGVVASEFDIVSVYDCFSSVLLQNIEGLRLCDFGSAPEYLASAKWSSPAIDVGRPQKAGTAASGDALAASQPKRPWLNPGGGMLRRGYLHGMNNVVDAVRGLRVLQAGGGDTGRALVLSGGMSSGSAVVLESL